MKCVPSTLWPIFFQPCCVGTIKAIDEFKFRVNTKCNAGVRVKIGLNAVLEIPASYIRINAKRCVNFCVNTKCSRKC